MGEALNILNAHVEVERDEFIQQVASAATAISGQSVTRPRPDTVVITRKHADALIVALCILLFPIGLLALLWRKTETLTVTVEEKEGDLIASAIGQGDPHPVFRLRMLLGPRPAPASPQ
jgi:hypothetical protein